MTRLLKTADFVTPLISGTWPGSSTLWLQCDHLLKHGVLKRFLPIRYTAVCCSHVESEHQFAPRTAINCFCRHVWVATRRGGKPWTITMVGHGALIYCDRSLADGVKSACPADQVHFHQDVILELLILRHSIIESISQAVFAGQTKVCHLRLILGLEMAGGILWIFRMGNLEFLYKAIWWGSYDFIIFYKKCAKWWKKSRNYGKKLRGTYFFFFQTQKKISIRDFSDKLKLDLNCPPYWPVSGCEPFRLKIFSLLKFNLRRL